MNNKIQEFCQQTGLTAAQTRGEFVEGDIDLYNLTSMPEGITLTAGGGIYLNSLTALPEGITLTAGGSIDLRSLTSMPEGTTLTAGGDVYLDSLTSMSEGTTLTAGGYIYLQNLISLPEGITLTAGGYIDLQSLTSMPEGTTLTAGGSIDLRSLTSMPEGTTLTAGGTIYLARNQKHTVPKPCLPLTTPCGKHIIVDDILSEALTKKGNVYRVKIVGKQAISYLVTDGQQWSHGATLKEARESLVYKLSSRSTTEYEQLTLDSKLSFKEAVQCYRAITGACAQGTRWFVEKTGTSKRKKHTVKEIIELTAGHYGNQQFAAFFAEKQAS